MVQVWMKYSGSTTASGSRTLVGASTCAITTGLAQPRPWFFIRCLLPLAIAALTSSATPDLTAAEAAKCPGQYVHVRATVVGFRIERANLCVLSLDRTGPKCPLLVVVKPDLVGKLQLPPAKLKGRVVLVQGFVQATAGATSQIWLDRAPALSLPSD